MKSIESFTDRVIHGNCIDVMQSIPAESVDLAVTDPPYLVKYLPRDGRRCSNDDNDQWLRPAFHEIYRVLKPNALCATFYGWPWIERFMQAWKSVGFRPVSHLTWVKQHCSKEGYTRTHHEVGFLLAKGRPPKPFYPSSDVLPWAYTGNELHPNQKPIIAITPLIEAFSEPGEIVIDPFSGSGTTGIAAKSCNRRFILIEEVHHHFETALNRIHQFELTNSASEVTAVLDKTRQTGKEHHGTTRVL